MTEPSCNWRTFFALGFMTVWPMDTWPSPATTTLPFFRTDRMVVPCQTGRPLRSFALMPRHMGCCAGDCKTDGRALRVFPMWPEHPRPEIGSAAGRERVCREG